MARSREPQPIEGHPETILRGCGAGLNRSSRLGEGVSLTGPDSLGLYPAREEKPHRHQNRGETCRTHILIDS